MLVNDLEISQQQVSEPAQRLLDRAAEEARRRHHTQLWYAHPLLAFAHTERDLFHAAFEDIGVDGARVIAQIEAFLDTIPSGPDRELRIPAQTRLVCKLALRRANRVGRPVMTPARRHTSACEPWATGFRSMRRPPRRSAARRNSAQQE